ncbi:MAG: hypothetical protein APF84_04155 [Gracilibacter sp. BRH_c7a]|nr:MAG: hypothetical protein APF84_04155 [Gracilibacter sp. BRH_c7a]
MKLKEYLTISNLLYIGTMVFALGVIIKILIDRYQLPAGACPVDNSRTLLYIAITLLIGVNLGTSAYSYWKKKTEEH